MAKPPRNGGHSRSRAVEGEAPRGIAANRLLAVHGLLGARPEEDDQGALQFREDIYDRDAALMAALRKRLPVAPRIATAQAGPLN